jgi:probable F420-dependent oxidoreductase
MNGVQFSLSIVPFHDPGARDPYRRTFELCELAEHLGFDTVSIGHHHFGPSQISDPFSLLAAIAVRTSTIRVGTAIYLLAPHHPVEVAERLATIDQLSNGRVSLGVGLGWNPVEYAAFGARLADRGARLDEALTLLRMLWTTEQAEANGRFWSFPPITVYPRPIQRPHPPLYVAGTARRAIERAARLGDWWMCDPLQSLDHVVALRARYDAACALTGRPPRWVLRRYVWLGPSRAAMERDWLPPFVANQIAYWRIAAEGPGEREVIARLDAGEDLSPRDIAAGRFIGGAVDDVVAGIAECETVTGCEHISVGFGGGISGTADRTRSLEAYEEQRSMIERFGREVLPAFR